MNYTLDNEARKLLGDLRTANSAAEQAERKVENFFRPLVEKALKDGNIEYARYLAAQTAPGVAFAFLMDTIRQHTLKLANLNDT